MPLRIRTVADLEALLARRGLAPRPDRLVLDVGGITETDARAWEAKLSRYYFACGCEVASVVLLLALFGYLVVIAASPGGLGAATWGDAVRGALVGFAAAAAGKAAGLVYARRRLRTTIRSLAARLVDADRGVRALSGA